MNVSIKPILRTAKKREDGTCPIWIRITAHRKTRFVSSGVAVEPKYWNGKKAQVRKGHPIAPALNARIEQLVTDLRQEALSHKTTTAEAVKRSISGVSGSFSSYFQQHIDMLHEAGRYWPWKAHRVTLGKLNTCFSSNINWHDLDAKFLRKYERHLKELGNGPNTIVKEMHRIHHLVRKAIKEGLITPLDDPFVGYDKPKKQATERRKLTPEEIQSLEAAQLEPGSTRELARDSWLFAFYAGGMRFGDLCCLKVGDVNEKRITYRMNKTKALVSNPLPPQAILMANHYGRDKSNDAFLFPHLTAGDEDDSNRLRKRIASRNTLVNTYLKKVAQEVGVDPEGLSMHVARHSFADFARTKSGNLYAISKTLGHSDLKITEQYLSSFDQQAVDALGADLWS
ncbi:MAG: site-specific integrase [Rhodothermales bacterium]